MIKEQNGFLRIIIILIVIVIFAVGGVLFYQYWQAQKEEGEVSPKAPFKESRIVLCLNNDNICPSGCPYQLDKDCDPPKTWDLIASDNPEDYLGDTISYEVFSDWRHYEPLVKKVNELTTGLNTDLDKAQAIAKWVMHSKEYSEDLEDSVANEGGSIIDIFNAKKGVCLDASFLTAAMMRLAEIPARSVLSGGDAANEFYIDGNWKTINATFGPGEPMFLLSEGMGSRGTFKPYSHEESVFIEHASELLEFKNVTFYEMRPVCSTENYGYVTYPFSDTKIYVKYANTDIESTDFSLTKRENYVTSGFYCWWHSWDSYLEKYVSFPFPAGFYARGLNTDNQRIESFGMNGFQGSIKACSLEGKYKIICGLGGTPKDKPIAFTEFEIKANKEIIITANSFKIAEGTTKEQFNDLMTLFR